MALVHDCGVFQQNPTYLFGYFRLTCSNGGTTTSTVIAEIEPATTYSPVFDQAEYSVSDLPHTLPVGLDVGLISNLTISVKDLDIDQTPVFGLNGDFLKL